jgi:peroxiredoxin
MFQFRSSWIVVIAAGLALTSIGCSPKPSHEAAGKPTDKNAAKRPANQDRAVVQPRREPPPPATIPKVNLSDELRAGCLVEVGDALPKGELPDLADKTHSLASLYGKNLTVVCFWTAASRRTQLEAADTLRSLTNDVAKPFVKKGVQVIGIEVARNFVNGAAWESIRETVSKLPFPCLTDGKGQYLGNVCKDDKMPRVFLLDAKGKILWFDVEYSRSTREDLVQGIRVALGELK